MANFDPGDKFCWYFGPLTRDEANNILDREDVGVFLIRDSKSIKGDFVLCVREDTKTSHYIVNRIQAGGQTRFRIGDQQFADIPSMLEFYKTHYLDATALIRPAPREKVYTKFDFNGQDQEDLPFKKGEVLEIISKDEQEWWTARNSRGQVGQIPVPYVIKHDVVPQSPADYIIPSINLNPTSTQTPIPSDVKLPALAIATLARTPSAYDKRQLKLQVGDIVTVTRMNLNGQWDGEVNGKTGIFPFTHVRILTLEEQQEFRR